MGKEKRIKNGHVQDIEKITAWGISLSICVLKHIACLTSRFQQLADNPFSLLKFNTLIFYFSIFNLATLFQSLQGMSGGAKDTRPPH